MQSDQKFPTYVGGGDLWEEPIPEWRGWKSWLALVTFGLIDLW